MKKNKRSTKQRKAAAKRGLKRATKESQSKAQKHVRNARRKENRKLTEAKQRKKFNEMMTKLAGEQKEGAGENFEFPSGQA